MKKEEFDRYIAEHEELLNEIKQSAWDLHKSVGQHYDKSHPYGYHLSMVADAAVEYGAELIENENGILPVVFAAYYHDSIEDARLTYNDVRKVAEKYMSESQAYIAAEIVYALTNDKGRTRQERAGEKYYAGIRSTPYAPFVKLCDRFANMSYSSGTQNGSNSRMRDVYSREWPHFIEAISAGPAMRLVGSGNGSVISDKNAGSCAGSATVNPAELSGVHVVGPSDSRFSLPETLVKACEALIFP